MWRLNCGEKWRTWQEIEKKIEESVFEGNNGELWVCSRLQSILREGHFLSFPLSSFFFSLFLFFVFFLPFSIFLNGFKTSFCLASRPDCFSSYNLLNRNLLSLPGVLLKLSLRVSKCLIKRLRPGLRFPTNEYCLVSYYQGIGSFLRMKIFQMRLELIQLTGLICLQYKF